jgi:hypothetical protein
LRALKASAFLCVALIVISARRHIGAMPHFPKRKHRKQVFQGDREMKIPSIASILWGVAFGLLAVYIANKVSVVGSVVGQ